MKNDSIEGSVRRKISCDKNTQFREDYSEMDGSMGINATERVCV